MSYIEKIKEESILITKNHLDDLAYSIGVQGRMSYGYIGILGAILTILISMGINEGKLYETLFLGVFIFILSSYNVLGRRCILHSKMDKIFRRNLYSSYEEFLDARFRDLSKKINNAEYLLNEKDLINKIIFFMIVCYVLFIIIFTLNI